MTPFHQSKAGPGYVFLGVVQGNALQEIYANLTPRKWFMIEHRAETRSGYTAKWNGKTAPPVSRAFWVNAFSILEKFFDHDPSISPNSR